LKTLSNTFSNPDISPVIRENNWMGLLITREEGVQVLIS